MAFDAEKAQYWINNNLCLDLLVAMVPVTFNSAASHTLECFATEDAVTPCHRANYWLLL